MKNENIVERVLPQSTPGGDIEEGNMDRSPSQRKSLSMIEEQTFLEKITLVLALAAFASSLASIVMEGNSAVVKAACILMIILSPYSYYQQTRITDIRALKSTYTALKREVDRLAVSNKELKSSVERLDGTVTKLEDIQQVIEGISQTKGRSVESLLEDVKENKATVELMEKNVRAVVVQNILSVVFAVDEDGDRKLSKEETTKLIKSLQEINGVKVHEKKFRAMIKEKDGSIDAVMEIIESMLYDDSAGDTIIAFEDSS
jgi:hypothetical protein